MANKSGIRVGIVPFKKAPQPVKNVGKPKGVKSGLGPAKSGADGKSKSMQIKPLKAPRKPKIVL